MFFRRRRPVETEPSGFGVLDADIDHSQPRVETVVPEDHVALDLEYEHVERYDRNGDGRVSFGESTRALFEALGVIDDVPADATQDETTADTDPEAAAPGEGIAADAGYGEVNPTEAAAEPGLQSAPTAIDER